MTTTWPIVSNHRNITTTAIDPILSYALHRHSNQPLAKYSNANVIRSDAFEAEEKYADLELHNPNRRHHLMHLPSATKPGLLGSLTNLLDPLLPLLLCGVMALVANLLSSVLALLSQLNLTSAAPPCGSVKSVRSDQIDDKNALNHLLINNLERILRISFDMYEQKLAAQESKF